MDTPLTTPTYTELNFSNMDISSYNEFVALIKDLEINKTLTKLDLSNNYVWSINIAYLLRNNTTLTTLILSNTNIGRYDCVIPFTEARKTSVLCILSGRSVGTECKWIREA